jgi:hypothetical protein
LRLTIDEYCKHFKMSREMLGSKLKAKKINYIIENSTTYIIVSDKAMKEDIIEDMKAPQKQELTKPQITSNLATTKPKTTVATILALYQRENQQLKSKILQLEDKIDKLIDDKEQMLRDEMQKIEQVYSAKDAQLKTILELVNAKLMMEKTSQAHQIETLPAQKNTSPKLVELRSYIKTLDLESYQRKIIKKRFLAAYDNDIRIIQQNGELFLDFARYDYSDLLEY